MTIDELAREARKFDKVLAAHKKRLAPPDFDWYPYGTLNNFIHLKNLLSGGEYEDILALAGNRPIVDIGCADGDTAFFLESLGHAAATVDYPPTNFNGCRGVKALKQALDSTIGIHEVDLDAHFELPGEHFGLAFFLGILYHLKNPFGAMENLARLADHALVSTRITRHNVAPENIGNYGTNSERVDISNIPAAYLVAADETNNDASNFWMFTEAGLQRLFDRSGWDLLAWRSFGDTQDSDPATQQHDERAFCLLRSRVA